jgi:hypothetical protein
MTIKNDITSEIDSQIDAMSIGTGFNFDYDDINQFKPNSKTYPNVKTDYTDEDFLDPDEQMVDSYSATLKAKFIITVDNVTEPDSRLALSKVLQDFQRVLEAGHADLQDKGWTKADLLNDQKFFTNIVARPGRIEMEWEIDYRVKRSEPSETI